MINGLAGKDYRHFVPRKYGTKRTNGSNGTTHIDNQWVRHVRGKKWNKKNKTSGLSPGIGVISFPASRPFLVPICTILSFTTTVISYKT